MESRSNVNGPPGSTGPAPAAQVRPSNPRVTASNSRTFDHLKLRSHVPIVEGARIWSNSSGAAPARNRATSSIESPPASIDPTTESALVPPFAPCLARRTRCSTNSATPSFCASTAVGNSPADDTRLASS